MASPVLAIEVDGRIDPDEWRGAHHITDFRQVEPLTEAPATLPTEAWVLATPAGLAIGFHNTQPEGVPRKRQRIRRDQEAQVDRVNLMVDFDADGRIGYNFMLTLSDDISDAVITDESQFSGDWDGNWKHAVSEDAAGWSAEMLIPWYIAPMQDADDGSRTIGIYLDRVVGATGERVAWPTASFKRARFLSDFTPIKVTAYSQSLFAVTPYVLGLHDMVEGGNDFESGVDIFWKPNGQTQLTATINPDFGQVESDDLVVNFSAEETFFSDKRPFFTENHSIFNFGLLIDNSQLIYTRRVGAPADDGSGAGDIAAAVKLNGSVGATNYGVLAADERGEAGRTFGAVRINHDFDTQTLGMLATHVSRPWLDREAHVLGIDHRWQPTEKLTVLSNVVGSEIDQAGASTHGSGATLVVAYEMSDRWSQQWLAMHFGDSLDINDFGYLGRNNFNYAHWQVTLRQNDLPEDSAYREHEWRFRIVGFDNDHGLPLARQIRIMRQSQRRDAGSEFLRLQLDAAAYSDQLTRGHGEVRIPANASLEWERERPRKGNWAWDLELGAAGGGLSGIDRIGYDIEFEPTYFFSDALSLFARGALESTPDWLVWQHDNLIGSFEQHLVEIDAGLNWIFRERQELRVKLQALGLDARLHQAYRVVAGGEVVPVDDPVDDFSLRNLGFQIRYRYHLAPLSDLYVVYGRGGYALDPIFEDASTQFRDSFSLRDDEQFLIKLAYRFEL